MTDKRPVVLDANILIRAVLGQRVLTLLEMYETSIWFVTPEVCVRSAREYLPGLLARKHERRDPGLIALDRVEGLVRPVLAEEYGRFENAGLERISRRDPDDWPVVAAALLLGAPIWTEDVDFFGCGVATWTTDRVHIYLAGA